MSEQITSKECSKCKQIKSLSEFYKLSDNKEGYRGCCKICWLKQSKEYNKTEKGKNSQKRYWQSDKGKVAQKRYRQSDKRKAVLKYYSNHHPERYKARYFVVNAVRDGKLPRPDTLQCHYCIAQAKQYHHYKGYIPEHWLDVVPICRKCHIKRKKKIA